MNRKIGRIEKWRGKFGFIYVTNKERYFLPVSEFDVARLPIIGETVEFDFTPVPNTPELPASSNLLPVARNCKPVAEKEDGTGAL